MQGKLTQAVVPEMSMAELLASVRQMISNEESLAATPKPAKKVIETVKAEKVAEPVKAEQLKEPAQPILAEGADTEEPAVTAALDSTLESPLEDVTITAEASADSVVWASKAVPTAEIVDPMLSVAEAMQESADIVHPSTDNEENFHKITEFLQSFGEGKKNESAVSARPSSLGALDYEPTLLTETLESKTPLHDAKIMPDYQAAPDYWPVSAPAVVKVASLEHGLETVLMKAVEPVVRDWVKQQLPLMTEKILRQALNEQTEAKKEPA